jgi:hypothetical protein
MCIAAAVARCRHPSCSKPEATKLALRYGFLCAEADTVMVAISDHPTAPASAASFGIAMPSSGRRVPHDDLSDSEWIFEDCEEDIDDAYTPRAMASFGANIGAESLSEFSCFDAESLLRTRSCESLSSLKRQRSDDGQVTQPAQDDEKVHCPSLLDVLGALQRGSWSLQHPVVARFLSHHLPAAAALCSDDAHTTVAVIVVLRSKFKHSKAGWRVHVKRAAKGARAALGDAAYSSHKALVAGSLCA